MNLEDLFDEIIELNSFRKIYKKPFKRLLIIYHPFKHLQKILSYYFKNYVEKIKELAVNYLSKIYSIPRKMLSSIPVYIAQLPQNVAGLYYERGSYGIKERGIVINRDILKNPLKLAETIAHEMVHAIQSIQKRLKNYSSYQSYLKNYLKDENEIEARYIGKNFSNYLSRLYSIKFYNL